MSESSAADPEGSPAPRAKRRSKKPELDPELVRRELLDEWLRSRRTVHDFEKRAVPRELVLEALDLARFAPNHKLSEPWRFHLLGRRTAEKVAALNARLVRGAKGEEAARKKLERWLEIPGMLVISSCTSPDDVVRHQEDYAACACAAHNLALALWTRGVGTKWTTGPVVRSAEFHRLLGLEPSERYAIGLFFYGYPASIPIARRRPLDEVLDRLD